MKIEKINESLWEYKEQLKKISIGDTDYKTLLTSIASNFFYKIKKLDRNFLINYVHFNNEEKFIENKIQEDAFKYLFLLIIKNTEIYEIFRDFFPNYLEPQSIQSNWVIIRWLKNFLHWLLKPKLKFKTSQRATNLLNAIRDIKDRSTKKGNKKMYDLYQEITEFNALGIVLNELDKSRNLNKIYLPINEVVLLEENQTFFERQLSYLTKQEGWEDLDVTNLIQYSKELSIFLNDNNMYLKKNLDNLKKGLEKRQSLGSHAQTSLSKINSNPLTSEFKQLLSLNISQIQFYYEAYNKHFAEQNQQFYYSNGLELYKNLTKFGEILYQDKNLFFYATHQASSIDYIMDLSGTLARLSELAEFLKSIAKEIDPKILGKDILKLCDSILLHLSLIKENLRPYEKNTDFIIRGVACRSANLNSDSETEFSEIESSYSEQEEDDTRLGCDYSDQASLFYNATIRESLGHGESESGYSDLTSPESSNLSFSEAEKYDSQSKNSPQLYSFFAPKVSNSTYINTLGMNSRCLM